MISVFACYISGAFKHVQCHSRCGTLKNLHFLKLLWVLSVGQNLPVMVTTPYEWKILKRDEKPQTNKQIDKFFFLFMTITNPKYQLQVMNYWLFNYLQRPNGSYFRGKGSPCNYYKVGLICVHFFKVQDITCVTYLQDNILGLYLVIFRVWGELLN